MKKIEKGFFVDPEFRTNWLSSTPGGSEVTVHFMNQDIASRKYDNIKYPKSYIQSILNNDEYVESIYLDGELYWESKKADGLPF